ncbi:heavy metal transport/detoxification superfamily protein [Tasmannia lanceolata]|uniref:heavy metal transport/detoxification superfamily protein n=1 Tax=Tasmannia lanceolata TaxID=3420 RepID=UPI0040631E7E
MKKMVLKVNINCLKCKTDVMKAIAKLEGIDEISMDGEKGTSTIIGDVDPVLVVQQLRKIKKVVQIVSVGPPKPKPDPKPLPKPLPRCCGSCELVAIGFFSYERPRSRGMIKPRVSLQKSAIRASPLLHLNNVR